MKTSRSLLLPSRPRGVSVDLAREVGRRLGLPVELVTFTSAGNTVEAIKAGRVDLAFVAIDPVRAADMEYTAPYVVNRVARTLHQPRTPIQEEFHAPPEVCIHAFSHDFGTPHRRRPAARRRRGRGTGAVA